MVERCKLCNLPIQDGPCQLAAYKRTINGKEYCFCCLVCAERFEG
ncbi:MAG: transcriptional regulator [Candidatus Bathyarchaeia archaeon]